MKKLHSIFFLVLLFCLNCLHAQQPTIEWEKNYGGSYINNANAILQLSDGSYIVVGYLFSNDVNATDYHGNLDIWIYKITNIGEILWQKCLGGLRTDIANDIIQTSDNGFIICGTTNSNDGDVSGVHGEDDVWIVKLSSTFDIQWQKCFGGSDEEGGYGIQETLDGGYIFIAMTSSNDGDVSGLHGECDMWVVKLASNGNLIWQKCFGGSGGDFGVSIIVCNDGSYIAVGSCMYNNGDVNGNLGGRDGWIVKISSNGTLLWQKCVGGSDYEDFSDVQNTSDGGFICLGSSHSSYGDVTGNHGQPDIWIVKCNSNGTIQWKRNFGGSLFEYASKIRQTSDGSYFVSGASMSNDFEIIGNHGNKDIVVAKISSTGNILWTKCIGGSEWEFTDDLQITSDGGFIIAATSNSSDGDASNNYGCDDIWIVKFSPESVIINEEKSIDMEFYPNPTQNSVTLKSTSEYIGEQFILYNILGKNIVSGSITSESTQIDISNLNKGLYFLKVNNDTSKIIKLIIN